jgi:hypothetical protein
MPWAAPSEPLGMTSAVDGESVDGSKLEAFYLIVFALVTLGFSYFIALARTFLCLFLQGPEILRSNGNAG